MSTNLLRRAKKLSNSVPTAFTIPAVTDAEILAVVTSDAVTPTGYTAAAAVTTSGCTISIAGGAHSTFGVISPGQSFVLRATSSSNGNTQTTASVNIGGVTATWAITTESDASDPITILGSKLTAWLDFTDPTTMFSDTGGITPVVSGGTVACLKAKNDTAIQFVQGATGARPTFSATAYNGGNQPGVVFGGDDWLLCSSFDTSIFNDGHFGAYYSGNHADGAQNGEILGVYSNTDPLSSISPFAGTERAALIWTSNGVDYYYANSNSSVSSASSATGVHRWGVERDGTTTHGYFNGVEQDSSATPGAPSITSTGYLAVGGHNSGGDHVAFTVQHIFVLNDDLTSGERAALDEFMALEEGGNEYTLTLKNASVTGSMAQGAYVVTGISDTSGFDVGDPVIVESGNAAGGGAYGTIDVGGCFPSAHAANEAAVLALANVVGDANHFIYAEDTKKVYRNQNTGGAPGTGYEPWVDWYYYGHTVPQSLIATVVSKTSTTLTLDVPAVVATTNTRIVHDATRQIEAQIIGPTGSTYNIPAGDYTMSRVADITLRHEMTIAGAGRGSTIFRACRNGTVGVSLVSCNKPTMYGFDCYGNHAYDGSTGLMYNADNTGFNGLPYAIQISICTNPLVHDIGLINTFCHVNALYITDDGRPGFTRRYDSATRISGLFHDIYTHHTKRVQRYFAHWGVVISACTDSVGGVGVEFRDFEIDNDELDAGFEINTSHSSGMVDFDVRNAIGAVNSAETNYFINYDVVLEDNCRPTDTMDANEPTTAVFNLNSVLDEAQGTAGLGEGGILKDCNFDLGWNDATNGPVCAAVNLSQAGWTVTGTYWDEGEGEHIPDDGNRRGLILAPPPKVGIDSGAPGTSKYGSATGPQIIVGNVGNIVRGVRCEYKTKVGAIAPSALPEILAYGAPIANTEFVGNVADSVSPATINSDNITNAAYEAL